MRRHVPPASVALIPLVLSIACSDGGGVVDNGTVEIAGTWSVRVASGGSALTDCQGVTLVPDPAGYRGLLSQAESAGTISVDQNANRLTMRPVVDAQPSGLTATFSGDGSLVGSTVVATIELELTAPGRPAEVQSESLRGSIRGPRMLTLTADRWSVDTGGCVIEPPVAYEIMIQ